MKRKCARLFVFLFAICALCFAAFGVAACKNKNQDHKHTYGEWQITKPTETEVGSAVKTCSTCETNEEGHTITVTLPILGNEGYTKSADTATCEAGGEIVYTIHINNETISFAIKSSAKGHSFNEDFWLGDGFTHWHGASCGHNVKGNEAPCVAENDDTNCDICGYPIHQHTYQWGGDENEHWLEPTCCDTAEIKDKGSHIDNDNDDVCEICSRKVKHTHKYSKDWTFDENAHWHAPTCTDITEGSDEAEHTFENGICECGAIEVETNAYRILKEKADLRDSYADWLNSIKAKDVRNVTVSESGDVIYVYSNGTTEAVYVAERTVRVKAVASGEGIAHVWIMLSLYKDGEYQEINGMYALGIAETDEDGIAEITFIPISGYTSQNVDYRVRLAEKKDIATYLGVSEEYAPKPIPNRYTATGQSDSFITVEVNENAILDNVIGQLGFAFSKGWDAYEQFSLPYARYFEDPMNAESTIKEVDTTFEFTTSGGELFDYFYFIPSNKYSFASADSTFTPEQLAVIEKNFGIAASGVYKIYFEVEEGANATLYYWNEGGVNLGAYHVTKTDGTPSDDYITSISGGTAGTGKFTGANYVNVVIEPENGLRLFQFGLLCDTACKVKITVERTGDYVEETTNTTLGVGEANSVETYIVGYRTKDVTLKNVSTGLYAISVIPTDSSTSKGAGNLVAYTTTANKVMLWENSQYKGIIEILSTDKKLTVENNGFAFNGKIMLEPYELPELVADTTMYIPISNESGSAYDVPLDETVTAGQYLIDITLSGSLAAGKMYNVTVIVGENKYAITTTSVASSVTYSAYIQIPEGAGHIRIVSNNTSYNTLTAYVKLSAQHGVVVGVPTNVVYETTSTLDDEKFYSFIAPKEGTYRITLTLNSEAVKSKDFYYMRVENAYNSEQIIISNGIRENTSQIITTASGTFEMQEGVEIVLKFTRTRSVLFNFDFVIEFIED
ncbi:MAG: hypothetical protein J1G07_05295 [Clostridiales bacterium]|nr:hypothetical protein [Clostridiales bacterium]